MDTNAFRRAFWTEFNGSRRNQPDDSLLDVKVQMMHDLCPDVQGMLSLKKQRLLNLAFSLLPEGEAYLEVGTYMGKSLLSAMIGNPERSVYAVDNFSQFEENSFPVLKANLERYDLYNRVNFCNGDFREIFNPGIIQEPIGLYFYDGGHDYESQYLGMKLVEPFLADEALILVDDWRLAPDSGSYAKDGTLQAVAESDSRMRLLYELPARYNGDRGLWWNGVGVLSYTREPAMELAV